MRKIRLTVVTVTYNAEDFIERTINSVLEQDSDEFEYIIVDGASTDQTLSLIEQYSSRVSHCLSEPDSGIYEAMNKAVYLAAGEWIIFLNAGDTFCDKNTLRRLVPELDESYSFVFGDRNRVSDNGAVQLEKAGPIEDTLTREVAFHQSLVTKTALLKSRPYNTTYSLAADFEYVVRSWAEGCSFKKVPMVISNFLSGGRSRTQHTMAKLEASHILAKYHQGDHRKLRNNNFFRSLIRSNLGFTINSGLQSLKKKHQNIEFAVSTFGEKLSLSSNVNTPESNEFLSYINDAFSCVVTRNDQFVPIETSVVAYQPLFTIVTVTYNAADLLERTINSVTQQTLKDIEYIIIDGASTDGTIDIIKANSGNVTTWVSERDTGIYDAMNKGIALATGKWINFMNAGDVFSDMHVLSQVSGLVSQETDVIYGDRYYIKQGKKELQKAKPISTIFERMPFGHQSTFVRTELIKKYRFNDTYKFAADYNLLITLYLNGFNFKYVDIAICDFLAGGQSESGLRPYLETIKILLDSTNDPKVILKNVYFNAFRRINKELFDKVAGE